MKKVLFIFLLGGIGGIILFLGFFVGYSKVHKAAISDLVKLNPHDLEVIGIEDKTVLFNDGSKFQTNLYDLEFIGQLPALEKIPYLILSGRQCNECDANISIYIHSPSEGPLKPESEQVRYGYPGEVSDWESGELISETRTFYGEVLPNNFGVIWYQKDLDEDEKWISSTYFAGVHEDSLFGSFIDEDIEKTLIQVDRKSVFEIDGINRSSEP